MRIFILDDDCSFAQLVMNKLEAYLKSIGRDASISTFSSYEELLPALSLHPDILFTDIELSSGGNNGIAVAKELVRLVPSCKVIFITSYMNYALEVYEAEHFWFIVKDELEKRLPIAMERYFQITSGKSSSGIVVSYGHEKVVISQSEIIYCEVKQRKICIVCDGHTEHTYEPLSSIQSALDDRVILRCHNSYVVNLERVTKFRPNGFEMSNGDTVPISRRYKEHAKQAFLSYTAFDLGFSSCMEDGAQ